MGLLHISCDDNNTTDSDNELSSKYLDSIYQTDHKGNVISFPSDSSKQWFYDLSFDTSYDGTLFPAYPNPTDSNFTIKHTFNDDCIYEYIFTYGSNSYSLQPLQSWEKGEFIDEFDNGNLIRDLGIFDSTNTGGYLINLEIKYIAPPFMGGPSKSGNKIWIRNVIK